MQNKLAQIGDQRVGLFDELMIWQTNDYLL